MSAVAIMQPTYMPWSGYFGLMRSVDLFVFLDSVQFAKRSWQQRNQIKTPNGAAWLTVPVLSKGKRYQLIQDVEIDRAGDFPQSHQRSLELNYKKTKYFDVHGPHLSAVLAAEHVYLADMTIALVTSLRDILGITTPLRRSREFAMAGTNAELLASLCEQVGATEYVSPPGSREYLDKSDAFSRRGIPVRYFQYIHPTYEQRFGDFIPYLSVVDMLFSCGPATLQLIESGCERTT